MSKPILKKALLAFKDEGYVQRREGKYPLNPSFEASEARITVTASFSSLHRVSGLGARRRLGVLLAAPA